MAQSAQQPVIDGADTISGFQWNSKVFQRQAPFPPDSAAAKKFGETMAIRLADPRFRASMLRSRQS